MVVGIKIIDFSDVMAFGGIRYICGLQKRTDWINEELVEGE